MCCAIVALTMTLLAGRRGFPNLFGTRVGRLRRVAIVVIATAAAAGSAIAADQFAAGARAGALPLVAQPGGLPLCLHSFR
jgi:hypothetical protein